MLRWLQHPSFFWFFKKRREKKRGKGEERKGDKRKKEGEQKGKLGIPIIGREQENVYTFQQKESIIKSKKDTKDLCFRDRNLGVKKYLINK